MIWLKKRPISQHAIAKCKKCCCPRYMLIWILVETMTASYTNYIIILLHHNNQEVPAFEGIITTHSSRQHRCYRGPPCMYWWTHYVCVVHVHVLSMLLWTIMLYTGRLYTCTVVCWVMHVYDDTHKSLPTSPRTNDIFFTLL